jgi:hypothetical protein
MDGLPSPGKVGPASSLVTHPGPITGPGRLAGFHLVAALKLGRWPLSNPEISNFQCSRRPEPWTFWPLETCSFLSIRGQNFKNLRLGLGGVKRDENSRFPNGAGKMCGIVVRL